MGLHPLYGDMSDRVMNTLRPLTERLEVYSIDEAFALLPGMPSQECEAYGRTIRSAVLKQTGIPVSVGIAPTKTLAKIALELIKKTPTQTGALDIGRLPDIESLLAGLGAQDVWGVGPAFAARLSGLGVRTAKDLKYADWGQIRQALHLNGLRMALELNNRSCLPLKEIRDPCQSVVCSRSFAQAVRTFEELSEAVAAFAARAAEKLRREKRAKTGTQTCRPLLSPARPTPPRSHRCRARRP
ncbi:MAG: hypothetical protein WAN46_13160 [Gammaproteobacteria bacterium]